MRRREFSPGALRRKPRLVVRDARLRQCPGQGLGGGEVEHRGGHHDHDEEHHRGTGGVGEAIRGGNAHVGAHHHPEERRDHRTRPGTDRTRTRGRRREGAVEERTAGGEAGRSATRNTCGSRHPALGRSAAGARRPRPDRSAQGSGCSTAPRTTPTRPRSPRSPGGWGTCTLTSPGAGNGPSVRGGSRPRCWSTSAPLPQWRWSGSGR